MWSEWPTAVHASVSVAVCICSCRKVELGIQLVQEVASSNCSGCYISTSTCDVAAPRRPHCDVLRLHGRRRVHARDRLPQSAGNTNTASHCSKVYHTERPRLSNWVDDTLWQATCRGEIFWAQSFGKSYSYKSIPLFAKIAEFPENTV